MSLGSVSGDGHGSPLNALTFDLEHWHMATLVRDSVDDPKDAIERSTTIVLDQLERHDVRATFFVVGEVANEYPDLVRRVAEAGHEIGSHGQTHTPLFELTEDEFAQEMADSTKAIRRAAGVDPIGFRAPNFSVTEKTAWAFRVLEASGYRYDSSVFPTRTPMYGVSEAPTRPYRVDFDQPFVDHPNRGSEFIEYPVSVVGDRIRVPIAGGFYARVLPTSFLKRGIKALNDRGAPAIAYFHPWEFNPDVRVDTLPIHRRFVSFHGVETLESKVEELLTAFDWGTIRDLLDEPQSSTTQTGTDCATERDEIEPLSEKTGQLR